MAGKKVKKTLGAVPEKVVILSTMVEFNNEGLADIEDDEIFDTLMHIPGYEHVDASEAGQPKEPEQPKEEAEQPKEEPEQAQEQPEETEQAQEPAKDEEPKDEEAEAMAKKKPTPGQRKKKPTPKSNK